MRSIFIILLLISTLVVHSQTYYSRNVTSREGLPVESIRKIFEDSRGVLWIGTDGGVCRWDGETFKTYNTLDGMAGNKIWWIDEDKAGNMWFACFGGGISYFDGKTFTSYTEKDGLVDNSVRVIKYSKQHDCMAIGTNSAISIWKDSTFYNFSQENNFIDERVVITGILENNKGIAFYDFHYLNRLVSFTDGIPELKLLGDDILSGYRLTMAYNAKNGDEYFGWGYQGIINKHQHQYTEIPEVGQVFGIAEDALGDIWTASWNGGGINGTYGGLSLISNNKAKLINSVYKFSSTLGWSVFYEKKQHQIFYGTLDKGFYKIPPQYFEYYSPSYFEENELEIKDIEIDADNKVWFITKDLLVNWDKDLYEKKHLDEFYQARIKFGKPRTTLDSLNQSYNNGGVLFNDIEFDHSNNLWLTIQELDFFKIPNDDRHKIEAAPFNYYQRFEFDEDDALFQCHDWSKVITKYVDFKNSSESLVYSDSSHRVFLKELYSYKNEIWATSRIANVFMYKDDELRVITIEDTTINKLVNDICFDAKGYAYLAGVDGRIEILSPETRQKVFEISLGSHHYSVHWLEVSQEMLFAGCSDGLRVYKLEDIRARNTNHQYYSESEGYIVPVVNSSVVDENEDIWLGTNNGLLKIAAKLFKAYKYLPLKTVIQKVEILNEVVNWENYGLTDTWTTLPLETPNLAPYQNHLSIYFHTLNYINPQADLYYYKLNGIDKDWVGPSNKKYVIYPNLNSGSYEFMVKSKSSLSGLFTPTATFSFHILTPWYLQLWFYILLILIVLGVITVLYKMRIKVIKTRGEKKSILIKKISDLETKALQAQMNPHFLFNALSSIQNFIINKDVDNALLYLNSFSRIIRMTLEFVDKKFIALSDELIYLEYYVSLENMRFDYLFDYEVVIGDDIDKDSTMIPPMLLQPIIENSIKHGLMLLKTKGKILLKVQRVDEYSFKCIIEDNGVGRVQSEKNASVNNNHSRSIGLKITKERLEMLNDKKSRYFKLNIIDLYDVNNKASGTRTEIFMGFIL